MRDFMIEPMQFLKHPRSVSPQPYVYSPDDPLLPAFARPAMDLQYILSPNILDDQEQHQEPQQPPVHPPLVFQDKHQLGPDSEPVPSSSRIPPQHVHPNPDDAIINFDSKTRSFPKPSKPSTPTVADPYAEAFLRDMLGPEKWETFSTRLFERRLGGKGKGKDKAKQGDDDDPKSGASAVEFLVKVEVVKSILRECVPHPYNPRKSLSHPFPAAPSGHVTLTRSTVLLLCGWSNTQFSYWARRSEAVSVLAEYDHRLRAVGAALERRLHGDLPPAPDDEDDAAAVTGKGLDTIIEDVKKRTGKSQFLRGKHSSLDPFGTPPQDPAAAPPQTQFATPTFQAERYEHGDRDLEILWRRFESTEADEGKPLVIPVERPKLEKRINPHLRAAEAAAEAAAAAAASASHDSSTAPIPQLSSPAAASAASSSSLQTSPSPRATRSSARKAAVAADDNVHHFPVSDSRSEVEKPASTRKRKASDNADTDTDKDTDGSPSKRARVGEAV